ncbi:hypothetical protein WQQ_21410 [Hydrocarboniphaga effusa AP103]|uniref:Uncharacterized protein n=1 Tax=Hydrocarboniphaga effusa AP103 TaxID=1172194 RepID=I7ZJB7_9GAMM|nr:hypothetical protein WQQ_21410 [Hydrocarboniphaga effusa AP103]
MATRSTDPRSGSQNPTLNPSKLRLSSQLSQNQLLSGSK